MRNVIIYVRVSTEDQKEHGYSLDSQRELLILFAKKQGWNVLRVFEDDFSAWKGFDRPGYNKLKQFIVDNKKSINGLIFTQWSRFSRETTEALVEIRRLRRLGIEPNAIEQWIDFSIPENMFMLSIYITAPQVENDRLSQRTKAGNRQALKQGRWLWKAPFGYTNNRLTKLIEVVDEEAEVIRSCFQMMASGLYNAEEVRRKYAEDGMRLSKQGFLDMLQNVVYIGKIKVPAFNSESEQLVAGQHIPIVRADLFEDVQLILKGKKKPYKGQTQKSNLPLIGHLYCPLCKGRMTGSASRGNGGIYHYYHCQRIYGCKNQIKAELANNVFLEHIKNIQPDPEVLELYHLILQDVFDRNSSKNEDEKKALQIEIEKINSTIDSAINKHLSGVYNDETFIRLNERLEAQKSTSVSRLKALKNMKSEFQTYINYSTSLLANISGYYQNSSVETKKKIIGSIYPDKIYFINNSYRTTRINEVVELILNGSKDFKQKSLAKSARLSSVAPPSGLEPETL
jgi:site-specific DNA recombinase